MNSFVQLRWLAFWLDWNRNSPGKTHDRLHVARKPFHVHVKRMIRILAKILTHVNEDGRLNRHNYYKVLFFWWTVESLIFVRMVVPCGMPLTIYPLEVLRRPCGRVVLEVRLSSTADRYWRKQATLTMGEDSVWLTLSCFLVETVVFMSRLKNMNQNKHCHADLQGQFGKELPR